MCFIRCESFSACEADIFKFNKNAKKKLLRASFDVKQYIS